MSDKKRKELKHPKQLVFTIGPPGSGKTTWALKNYPPSNVVSADDYPGLYTGKKIKKKLLRLAHEWCQERVWKLLLGGKNVVVCNTNTTLGELYIYIAMVVFGKFPHKIVFRKFTETNIETLFKRNLHGVPKKTIIRMLKNIQKMFSKPLTIHRILASGGIRKCKYHRFIQNSLGQKIIYIGVFFDSTTESTLRKKITEETKKELLTNEIKNLHVTTSFAPQFETVQKLSLGEEFKLFVIGYYADQYIQTLVVKPMEGLKVENKIPHITVSTAKDVKPVTSNIALKYGKISYFDTPLEIVGKVGAYNGGKVVFEKLTFP